MDEAASHPKSVEAAVLRLLEVIPEASLRQIAKMQESDIAQMHFGLGMWIRNNFGLWAGNNELMSDTGEDHADNASGVILHALWKRLKTDEA